MCSCYQLVIHARITKYADSANFYTKQAVNILFSKTFFSNSIKLTLQLYTKQMNINIVVVGISLLPVVKMNSNIVVVGISLLPAVKMNGRCALIKTLAIPITGILSLTMYPGHSHKGSRPPTYRTRTLLTLI